MRNSPFCDGMLVAFEEGRWTRFDEALFRLEVPPNQRPFFKTWVERWLKMPPVGTGENGPRLFARALEERGTPDWQCRQAFQAVRIWLDLNTGMINNSPAIVHKDWASVLETMERRLLAQQYSPRSIKSYLDWSRRLVAFHSTLPKDSAEASVMVQEFLEHLAVSKNLAPASISQARNALAWLVRKELGFTLVLDSKGSAHHSRKLPKVLARQTVKKILDGCQEPWDLMFGLQYGCGLRLGELLELRIQDLDLDRGILTVRSGKGDKDRQVPLPKKLSIRLVCHLGERRLLWEKDLVKGLAKVDIPHGLGRKFPQAETSWEWQHLFGATRPLRHPETGELRRWHPMENLVRDALRAAATRAGVEGRVHPHLLRHCFATHLVESGVGLSEVQQLMGHAQLATTMIYLHVRSPGHMVRSPLDQMD